jgi:hypothetical protein
MTARERLPTGSGTSSRRGLPRIDGKDRTTQCAARIDCERIASAKSQRFDRPLMTLWRVVGAHVDCTCLIDEARIRQRSGASRTLTSGQLTNGRQDKSAAFGRAHVVGWIELVRWHVAPPSWRFKRKLEGFQQAKRHRHSARAQLASRGVAPREFRPFGSTQMSWHTAAMTCPRKSRRPASLLRSSAGRLTGRPGRER